MGGLLHLINFNQGSMARKVVKHNRHGGGLEAPRNSMESPLENFQGHVAVGEYEPYPYQTTMDCFERNHYQTGAPMKKLISEEISKKSSTKNSVPSIVARLMGVDMLPLDTRPMVKQVERNNEKVRADFPCEDWTHDYSINRGFFASNPSRHRKSNSFDVNIDRHSDQWIGSMNSKPKSREHPQEKELQKFKKEFEAWQAARFRECSKFVEIDSVPYQCHTQEKLDEKMVIHANSRNVRKNENARELKSHALKAFPHERPDLECSGRRNEHAAHSMEACFRNRGSLQKNTSGNNFLRSEQNEAFTPKSRMPRMVFEQSYLTSSFPKMDLYSAPTKIVILRPGPDRIGNDEDSWATSSGTSEERGSIEEFLEEVKERLKCEIEGKTFKKGVMVRGGGIETPFHEKPSDPKQIAQCIAKQVRDSVSRDLGMSLLRSESTRSYKNEIHFNKAGSPDFISRDTRRLLSERLKNVMNSETHQNSPISGSDSSSSFILENATDRLEELGDNLNGNKIYWDNCKGQPDMRSRSFRRDSDDEVMLIKELSPRNLIRSLSAPVSGTSFGKLLLEDRHLLTGAHIRRKHEAIEKVTLNVRKGKKEKFNFREKVSSFKYSFTLKGRLFRRKIQTLEESHGKKCDFMKDIMGGPTVVMNFNDRLENSTEVPPSPASVCSSPYEELGRPGDCLSPTATPDVPSLEDDAMPQVFKEISSNIRELRKQLNLLETGDSEDTVNEPYCEAEVELQDPTEAYIKDLLVASGFYDGLSFKSLSRWDPFSKPICQQVFEGVEKSYRKGNTDNAAKEQNEKVDHKILFDLLNEALSAVLRKPTSLSRFMRKAISTNMPPRGRKLLNLVCKIIRLHVYPSLDKSCCSLDALVAQEIQSVPWAEALEDDTNSLGKDVECQLIGDLIEEIARDMKS